MLKEHDYIGLSEASSSVARMTTNPPSEEAAGPPQDTDLRLDLGLGLGLGSRFARKEGEEERKASQVLNQGVSQLDSNHASNVSGLASSSSKKWMKRGFSETMAVMAMPTVQNTEGDTGTSKQSSFFPTWAPSKPTITAWQLEKPGKFEPHVSTDNSRDPVSEDAPPAKDRVVGWPPVRSYRRQTLAKPAEMFVKVNMDGITVGRKVDLNAYTSYETLLLALEEMFQPSSSAQGTPYASVGRDSDLKHFLLSNGSDFVLTYEDKDGDWMLVGDVPWSMFVSTVKRLRITRGSEATGSGTRALGTSRLHA